MVSVCTSVSCPLISNIQSKCIYVPVTVCTIMIVSRHFTKTHEPDPQTRKRSKDQTYTGDDAPHAGQPDRFINKIIPDILYISIRTDQNNINLWIAWKSIVKKSSFFFAFIGISTANFPRQEKSIRSQLDCNYGNLEWLTTPSLANIK